MIKWRNHTETENQIINQLAAEKCVVYLSIADQIHVLSLVPGLNLFGFGLVNYSLVFL